MSIVQQVSRPAAKIHRIGQFLATKTCVRKAAVALRKCLTLERFV
jgi:hypothetical protein